MKKVLFLTAGVVAAVLVATVPAVAEDDGGFIGPQLTRQGVNTVGNIRAGGRMISNAITLNPNPSSSSSFSEVTGVIYFDEAALKIKYYDGTAWRTLSAID